eukprot:GILI01022880.1.p1 GENE.GILI01022880.1~~GILI01022880.1.p1  ORF type:complete len:380 (-),score=29.20 GILI01022880.1:49-1044(-)
MFSQALQSGLNVLETDANEVRRIVASTHRTFSSDPIATSRVMSHSPFRDRSTADPITPRYQSMVPPPSTKPSYSLLQTSAPGRNQSPVRSHSHSVASASPGRSAVPMSTSSQPSYLTRSPQPYAHQSAIQPPQPPPQSVPQHTFDVLAIPGSQELLAACARSPIDSNEVTFLLRQNQAAVNALDQLDNTPLHVACMNPMPSLDAIHALLLAGANTSLKNSAGLTPFHLACLNYRGDGLEHDHKLKRFLIFKGAQNPNQRTSRGETAAHLCSEDDKHFDSLVFLVGAGVDAAAPAMYSNATGSRQMTAIDVAQAGGSRSAKNAEFLLLHCNV